MEEGFNLEAITLVESMVSDRLESRGSFLSRKDCGFKTLGEVLRLLRAHERDHEFLDVYSRIDAWRTRRNKALHEMVKFEERERDSWEDRIDRLRPIAREGLAALRAFDKLDQRDRRRNGGKLTATAPDALH